MVAILSRFQGVYHFDKLSSLLCQMIHELAWTVDGMFLHIQWVGSCEHIHSNSFANILKRCVQAKYENNNFKINSYFVYF